MTGTPQGGGTAPFSGLVTKSGNTPSDTNPTIGAYTGRYKMDVVPYISKISTTKRNNSGLKDNNVRSASGKYSIIYAKNNSASTYASDFITVNGFNLNPNAARIVKSSIATSRNVTTTSGVTITPITSHTVRVSGANTTVTTESLGYTEFWGGNNISYSGYLEVFTNGIRTLNNINNNNSYGTAKNTNNEQLTASNATVTDYASAYNREPDYILTKNVQFTDDRYIRVWDMKDTKLKNGYYPNMIMDGNDPVFGYVDLNGATKYALNFYVPDCYQPQRTKFSGTDGTYTDITYLEGGISMDQMVMVKDEAGKYIHATVYNYGGATMDVIYNDYAEDHTWSTGGWGGTTYYDGWAGGTPYSGYNGLYSYSTNNNAIALESTNYGEGNLIGRYQNLRMVAKGDSTTTTGASIYMAYYDDNTIDKNIIFRTFKIGTNNTWTNRLNNGTRGTTGAYSNLPDRDTDGRIPLGENASKHLDIGVTTTNRVVIVYYDKEDACLKLKYSSAAIDGSNYKPNVTFNDANVTFPSYVGTDVSMVIDGNNGIHIAAYDAGESDLIYMYMPSYDSSTLLVSKVDQAFSVGNWTRIQIRGNNTDGYIPYIAYYNSTETGSRESLKLAYYTGTTKISNATEDDIQGVDSNNYTTGNWEYMSVPALTPPQGGDSKFRNVCLDFDTAGRPVLGYLGDCLEFGKQLDEQQ